jgi:hypothetical protein
VGYAGPSGGGVALGYIGNSVTIRQIDKRSIYERV